MHALEINTVEMGISINRKLLSLCPFVLRKIMLYPFGELKGVRHLFSSFLKILNQKTKT
jgi:hypothetical protein